MFVVYRDWRPLRAQRLEFLVCDLEKRTNKRHEHGAQKMENHSHAYLATIPLNCAWYLRDMFFFPSPPACDRSMAENIKQTSKRSNSKSSEYCIVRERFQLAQISNGVECFSAFFSHSKNKTQICRQTKRRKSFIQIVGVVCERWNIVREVIIIDSEILHPQAIA